MFNAPVRSVFGETTDFLATNPTPEAIIACRTICRHAPTICWTKMAKVN
ncbi:MAG: hypothetical protein H6672_14655 [Anaerolineaceae bacterium]|nr:hypothetical protein [Anaerolineaceae bacterium]